MTADYDAAIYRHRFDMLYWNGVLAGLLETVDEGSELLIENVAVAPDLQGQGLGRRLMAHAETIAAELGRTRIRLYTNQRFWENVRLYQRLGYVIDREENLGAATAVHMSKTLTSNGPV